MKSREANKSEITKRLGKKLQDKNPDYQPKGLNSNGDVFSDNFFSMQ